MKKRILALILVTAMAVMALVGCGGPKESVTLTVWGPQEETPLLESMIAAFKEENKDATYDIKIGVVGEPDLSTKYSEDPAAAADVFMMPNDQLKEMVAASSLYEVTKNKDDVIKRNVPGSIEAATIDDKLYAYPMTADNGYFLYYNKEFVSEEQVKSLDGLLEAANAASKKVFMDVSNGWYIASFFLGAGCTLSIDADGKQICDFNSEAGVKAGEAIKKFTADPAFLTGDDTVLTGGAKAGEIIAGVSGAWTAQAFQEAWGENYGATKLPTFTLGSEQVQMKSFGGFKLVGVNSLTKFPEHAMALADFLTSEKNQIERYKGRALGPSNIKASEGADVKADVALSALAAQSEFAISQKDVAGAYWSPAEAFGTAMENKDYSKSVADLLNEMVSQIQSAQ